MECKSCGKLILLDSRECPFCGHPVEDNTASLSNEDMSKNLPATEGLHVYEDGALTQRPARLRPLGYGEMFDNAIRLFFSNFKYVLGVPALLLLPIMILDYFLVLGPPPPEGAVPIFNGNIEFIFLNLDGFPVILFVLFLPLIQALETYIISNIYLGNPISFTDGVKVGRSMWLRLIGAGILFLIIIFVPAFIFMIIQFPFSTIIFRLAPSIGPIFELVWVILLSILLFALSVRFCMYPFPIVIEKVSARDGLERCNWLVSGSWWKLFSILFLTCLSATILHFGITAGSSYLVSMGDIDTYRTVFPLSRLISNCISIFLISFLSVITIIFYFDLRVRKEGFDLERLAEEIIR